MLKRYVQNPPSFYTAWLIYIMRRHVIYMVIYLLLSSFQYGATQIDIRVHNAYQLCLRYIIPSIYWYYGG
uniref:ASA1 n=1 Tax=Arundo donax TaxID=35708 RepID=A0A0A9CH63_ARUDO